MLWNAKCVHRPVLVRKKPTVEARTVDDKATVRKLVREMIVPMGIMTAVCWAFTLIWGFKLSNLAGFCVGFVYVWVCYEYLARSCERAVELDVTKAKRVMLVCYLGRFAGLFALCAAAMLTGYISAVGVLVPQLFPRIILTVKQFTAGKEG